MWSQTLRPYCAVNVIWHTCGHVNMVQKHWLPTVLIWKLDWINITLVDVLCQKYHLKLSLETPWNVSIHYFVCRSIHSSRLQEVDVDDKETKSIILIMTYSLELLGSTNIKVSLMMFSEYNLWNSTYLVSSLFRKQKTNWKKLQNKLVS